MKQPIVTATLFALLVTAPLAHAESGPGKGGLFGIGGRGDREAKTGLEVEVEHGVTTSKSDDRARVGAKAEITGSSLEARRTRAIRMIDERIASLNKLKARIAAMKRVSTKATLTTTIDTQISTLSDLKVKIQSTTDDATLKTHMESITKSERVYMLVMPQISILAATDKITTTADTMTTFGTKLETRINDAKTNGTTVTALTTAYASYTAHIATAKADAAAAVTLTANFKPDNGDKAVMETNKKALTDARAKLKSAQTALKAARKDAQTIVQGLKSVNISVEADVKTIR